MDEQLKSAVFLLGKLSEVAGEIVKEHDIEDELEDKLILLLDNVETFLDNLEV